MNLPFCLTAARLVAAPAIAALALAPNPRTSALAGVAVLAAGATDLADGYLARRRGQESLLGATLDLAADKLLLLSLGTVLTGRGLLPLWLLGALALREAAVGLLRVRRGRAGTFVAPSAGGKAKTAALTLGLAAVLFLPWLEARTSLYPVAIGTSFGLLFGGLLLSLLSAVGYFRRYAPRQPQQRPAVSDSHSSAPGLGGLGEGLLRRRGTLG